MKIHEYQGKEILRRYGVPVPKGIVARTVNEAENAAREIGGALWVVKAQIHAGGRGKGGGVKIAKSLNDVGKLASQILGMNLVTHQTGSEGKRVNHVLIEQGLDIARELYLGIVLDRRLGRLVVMASTEGGTEIEEVAKKTPEKILKVVVDPDTGLTEKEARGLASKLNIDGKSLDKAAKFLQSLYRAYVESDASLAEINPLVITKSGDILALDAKINLDDNALFRHEDLKQYRDPSEEDPREAEAAKHDLSYISLNGNIGCMVNGAGLAMATMDIIKLYGAEPANFLDVGGTATVERITEAFKLLISDKNVKVVLVNIFGGIVHCDKVAAGIVAAAKEVKLTIPLIVRLQGTHVHEGRKILVDSGLSVISAESMADAASKSAAALKGGAR